MANIHLVLQGKGGVGKSLVAFLLGQYFQSKEQKTLLIDTDPVNHTFSLVKSLGVQQFDITDGDDVDQRKFDDLIEQVSSCPDEPDEVVIDCGSSGFIGMVSYLISTQAIELLQDSGHQVIIHSLLVGGRDLKETLGNLARVSSSLPTAKVAVWLNHHLQGEVSYEGRPVSDSKTLKSLKGRLIAMIDLPRRKERLHGADIRDLMASHLTFTEAIQSGQFSLMSRQRLKLIWQETQRALDQTHLVEKAHG